MKEEINNITINELADIEKMTVRAFNILKYSRLTSLDKILLHYEEYGNFKTLRNCGNKTNKELISLCMKYKDYKIIQYEEESEPNNSNIEREIKTRDELKKITENLNFRQKTILNSFIKSKANNLSVRSYNALEKLLNKTFTIKNIYYYIFADKYFDFKNVRNVGSNSIDELNKFKSDVLEFINLVSLFKNENELKIEYYNSLLLKYFSNIDIKKLNNYLDNNGEVQIFNLINQLFENELILSKRELLIFKNTFNYFVNFKQKGLNDIASLICVTRERIRQLREKIYQELNTNLNFITIFEVDFTSIYNINIDEDLITIKNEIVDNINNNENNKFNKLFITKIISLFCNQTHELIGKEKDILFNTNKRFVNNWDTTYLIKKKLTKIFDFEKFANDIHNRLNKRITNSISFNFQSYLLKFYKTKDNLYLDEITDICELLLFEEFEIVLDLNENIVFHRNTRKKNSNIAKEILEEAQEPLNLKEIYKRLVDKYPNHETTSVSIGGAMRQNSDFIYFGRTSTYGLKIWEEKFSDIKGGTIRDIVEEYLNNYSVPKHIDDISKYVCKYRNTNASNIYSNIRMEENNRFVFLPGSYIGLKSKQHVEQLD